MNDGRYRGGGTIGGKVGCAFAAIAGCPLLGAALIIASMGQCAPDVECIPNWQLFSGAFIVTAVVGFTCRAAINAIARWIRRD